MNKLQCYAIFKIPDGYYDYLGFDPRYKLEFFNCSAANFDTDNVEGLIAFIQDVYKIQEFEIYWTILDPDHFCELHNISL